MEEREKRKIGEELEPGGRPKAPGRLEVLQRFVNTHNHDFPDDWDRLETAEKAAAWLADKGLIAPGESISEADAARLREAGVGEVVVAGNLKFDLAPEASLIERGRRWKASLGARPVVLAAVTREGEEASLLAAWRALTAARPLLVVVPRHPQRFEAVAALIAEAGFGLSRRSAWGDSPPRDAGAADVWLGDSMREMPIWYALADVALLGGSFEPLGGQNLIEAAACGCPVVMGPHTFNFADAAELALAAGAAIRVATLEEGVARALALVGQDDERRQRGAAGLAFAAAHRGAAARMVEAILRRLPGV